MKKLIGLIGSFALFSTTSLAVVACDKKPNKDIKIKKTDDLTKLDIKIDSKTTLGSLQNDLKNKLIDGVKLNTDYKILYTVGHGHGGPLPGLNDKLIDTPWIAIVKIMGLSDKLKGQEKDIFLMRDMKINWDGKEVKQDKHTFTLPIKNYADIEKAGLLTIKNYGGIVGDYEWKHTDTKVKHINHHKIDDNTGAVSLSFKDDNEEKTVLFTEDQFKALKDKDVIDSITFNAKNTGSYILKFIKSTT